MSSGDVTLNIWIVSKGLDKPEFGAEISGVENGTSGTFDEKPTTVQ